MFSDFFETKPVAKLLAKDIEAHHLTDDVLGRTLDALYEADVAALYQAIAEHVVDKLGLKTDSVHLDITSFHVDGEYAQDEDLNAIKLACLFTCKRLVVTPMMLRHSQKSLNGIFIA